jgi:WD40 repeat protein
VGGSTAQGHGRSFTVVTGDSLQNVFGGKDLSEACLFLPNGKHFVTAVGRQVTMWAVVRGDETRSFSIKSPGTIRSMACVRAKDGLYMAVGDTAGLLHFVDVASVKVTGTVAAHKGAVTALAYTPDGTRLVSGGEDKMIYVRALKGGTPRKLAGHGGPVTGLALTADGRFVVSSSKDRSVRVWSVAAGASIKTFDLEDQPTGVALVPKGKQIFTSGSAVRELELPAAALPKP